jgi:hypothetical protein
MKNMDIGDLRPRQVIYEEDQVIDEEHEFW